MIRAVRFHEPGDISVLKIESVSPPVLDSNKVLVRVHFAGLNRVDAAMRGGMFPHKLMSPIIPGMEGSGIVEDVGRGVRNIKKGDRVIIYTRKIVREGTCSQLVAVEEDNVWKLPERYSLEEGASIPLAFMTSYYALVVKGQVQPFEIVLVNGASGSVGLAAIDICKTLGIKIVGTAGHTESLDAIRDQGGIPLNYKESNLKRKLEEDIGPEKGIDVLLEQDARHIANDLTLLDAKGRLILLSRPNKESIDFGKILNDEITIMGMKVTNVSDEHYESIRVALDKSLQAGNLHPRVERVFRMDEIQKAHQELVQPSHGRTGKLVLDLRH